MKSHADRTLIGWLGDVQKSHWKEQAVKNKHVISQNKRVLYHGPKSHPERKKPLIQSNMKIHFTVWDKLS
ncbi:hypothetical protein AMECASPLE_017008 [Ameca splendens]|uniref:Uncharacterized protein n=1 Tax=Ameca splendens TaxID=208324 RepID=A0ABV0ZP96_9TELE